MRSLGGRIITAKSPPMAWTSWANAHTMSWSKAVSVMSSTFSLGLILQQTRVILCTAPMISIALIWLMLPSCSDLPLEGQRGSIAQEAPTSSTSLAGSTSSSRTPWVALGWMKAMRLPWAPGRGVSSTRGSPLALSQWSVASMSSTSRAT